MPTKSKSFVALALVTVAVGFYLFVSYPLPRFARRIAVADRVVASTTQGHVSITLTGDNAKALIQAVSSAKRERPPWGMGDACIYDVRITFFEGAKALGDILSCTELFIVDRKKYRDETGMLGKLAVLPVHQAYAELLGKQMESK